MVLDQVLSDVHQKQFFKLYNKLLKINSQIITLLPSPRLWLNSLYYLYLKIIFQQNLIFFKTSVFSVVVSVVDICSASQAEVYIYLFSIHNFIFRKKRKKLLRSWLFDLSISSKWKKAWGKRGKGNFFQTLLPSQRNFQNKTLSVLPIWKKRKKC